MTFFTQGSCGSDRTTSLGRQFLCTGAHKPLDNLRHPGRLPSLDVPLGKVQKSSVKFGIESDLRSQELQ